MKDGIKPCMQNPLDFAIKFVFSTRANKPFLDYKGITNFKGDTSTIEPFFLPFVNFNISISHSKPSLLDSFSINEYFKGISLR